MIWHNGVKPDVIYCVHMGSRIPIMTCFLFVYQLPISETRTDLVVRNQISLPRELPKEIRILCYSYTLPWILCRCSLSQIANQHNKHESIVLLEQQRNWVLSFSIGRVKHRLRFWENADLFKSMANRLQEPGWRICNKMLAFNSAKPAVGHSGLILHELKHFCSKKQTLPATAHIWCSSQKSGY